MLLLSWSFSVLGIYQISKLFFASEITYLRFWPSNIVSSMFDLAHAHISKRWPKIIHDKYTDTYHHMISYVYVYIIVHYCCSTCKLAKKSDSWLLVQLMVFEIDHVQLVRRKQDEVLAFVVSTHPQKLPCCQFAWICYIIIYHLYSSLSKVTNQELKKQTVKEHKHDTFSLFQLSFPRISHLLAPRRCALWIRPSLDNHDDYCDGDDNRWNRGYPTFRHTHLDHNYIYSTFPVAPQKGAVWKTSRNQRLSFVSLLAAWNLSSRLQD